MKYTSQKIGENIFLILNKKSLEKCFDMVNNINESKSNFTNDVEFKVVGLCVGYANSAIKPNKHLTNVKRNFLIKTILTSKGIKYIVRIDEKTTITHIQEK